MLAGSMSEDVFGIVGTLQAGVFRVERVVAEGGFAVIYRAYHEGFRAPVALKCLKVPDAMSEAARAAFLEKFRAEGELLFRLSALVPTVVRPLHVDILVLGETLVPFLALEWLEGETLDQIVQQRRATGKPPIDVRRLVSFLQPAAQALAQAHQMPGPDGPVVVVHRDVKPDNVFVVRAPEGEVVKILDFGIARTRSATHLEPGELPASGAVDAFTPGYAAPEQWRPRQYGQVGPWTDVFGLALTMVEVLAGRPAIDGDLAAMDAQTSDRARRPTPRTLGVAVPEAVERAFARALAVDPRERTRSITAFWTELETALAIAPSIRLSDGKVAPRSLTGPSDPPPSAPARAPAPASRVRRPEGDLSTTPGVPRASAPPAVPFELADPGAALPPSPASRPRVQPGAPAPRPAASIPLAAPLPREQGTLAGPGHDRAAANVREQLRGPIGMVIVAIAITVGDVLYTRSTGELFQVASFRPMWVSAPLALIGVGLACWRLLGAL
jgi:eukaryotic-like serine/threonine-protein kinase